MKTIGVIGSMQEEIETIKNSLEVISAKNIIGLDFYMGKMSGNNVILVCSGAGKVNAAISAQILIDLYAVDYIINIGVAGALSKELEIGDVIVSTDAVYHDFDATPLGYEPGVVMRMSESLFKADEELIKMARKALKDENRNIFEGRIATGDVFVASSEMKNRIRSLFKAMCVDMEGAAIAHTCYLNKIPFVLLKCISDKAEENSGKDFEDFMKKVFELSEKAVNNMVKLF